jgi:DNA-directed RNA polymerase specialized sigma24 family protein
VEAESWEQTLAGLASGRGAALKRHAFLLCGDEAQADDLVQEALVRAFTRPLRVPRPGAAEAYVRAIMVNLFIDGARRRSRWSPGGAAAAARGHDAGSRRSGVRP